MRKVTAIMWEAFWPLKGMKMQPTKKRAITKCVIACIATASCFNAVDALAEPYEPNTQTLSGVPTEHTISGPVSSALRQTQVVWTATNPTATTREVNLGYLMISTTGDGLVPAAYIIQPCGGSSDFEVNTTSGRMPSHVKIVQGRRDSPSTWITDLAEGSQPATRVDINLDTAPFAGVYTTCVSVTAVADDPVVPG